MALRSPAAHVWYRQLRPALPRGRRAAGLLAALTGLMLAGWLAGEVIRSWHATDLQVVRDVAAQRSPTETAIAHVLSRLGSSLLIGPLALACCIALYRKAGPAGALYVAASTAGAVVIFNVDKLLVGRPRPPVAHLEAAMHSSFPSGHATLSAAFYVALVTVVASRWESRPRAVGLLTAAVLLVAGIAASRVYLGVHYPTDVAAGVLLGGAWSAAVAISLRITRRPARYSVRHDVAAVTRG
jgi:membrane-associated phospholipid phosphatase